MNRREQRSIPSEILDEFKSGTVQEQEMAMRVWDLLGGLNENLLHVPSTEEALNEVEARIDNPVPLADCAPDRPSRRRSFRVRFSKGAFTGVASIVALIVLATLLWKKPVVVSVPHGQQVTVSLPDGSNVQLNSGSRLQYARNFGAWPGIQEDMRIVQLDGEGFFEVNSENRPFKVHTHNASITVLGTAFNVRSFEEDEEKETLVLLEHGHVSVSGPDDREAVELTHAGQFARVSEEGTEITEKERTDRTMEFAVAWRNKRFVATGLSFASLLKEIERRYDLDIQVSQRLEVEGTDVIITTHEPSIEEVLLALCVSIDCIFQKNNAGYTLYPSE